MSDTFGAAVDLQEFDRRVAQERRQIEDELMRDTGIVEVSGQVAELKSKRDAQLKRKARLQEEMAATNAELSQLKDAQTAAIDRCVQKGVPTVRLTEVTGLHPETLARRKIAIGQNDAPEPTGST